jgi:hypothetical protein
VTSLWLVKLMLPHYDYPGAIADPSYQCKGRTAKLIQDVMKELRLTDFDGSVDDMGNQYDCVLSGFRSSGAQLSSFGYGVFTFGIQKRIYARLQMVDYIKKHPQITSIQVRRPIFIIGFTRTGTTFLHEMLHLHPEGSSHQTWEQMYPVPSTHEETDQAKEQNRKKRYNGLGQLEIKLSNSVMGEGIQRIHRIGYDEIEGKILLFVFLALTPRN